MREKLNSSPMAQMGLIGVLLIFGVVLFLSNSGGEEEGGEEAVATTEATVSVAGTEVSATATGATPGEAVEGAVEGAVEEASANAIPATVPTAPELSAIEAPPLPKPITDAYKANKTVVVLVVHDGGIDDAFTALASSVLVPDQNVALFIVPASKISSIAAITLSLEVQRVPALIVMRPRNLSGGTPQATVSYGLQTAQDISQAVRDAEYKGPGATYHPN